VAWASACTASGDWQGARPATGHASVAIPRAGEVAFVLRCTGGGRDTTATVRVTGVERRLDRTVIYAPRPRTISTSEGAPYGDVDFWTGERGDTWHDYGPTKVLRTYICLAGPVPTSECGDYPRPTGPLPEVLLQDLEQRLVGYSAGGVRLLVRFIYNFGPIGAPDAPLDVILTHIAQLGPILLRQRDIVFALQAGFLGTWGEWHNSTHGNDAPSVQAQVLGRLRAETQGAFPILVRYPEALIAYAGGTDPDTQLGLHNDFFASDHHDGGTWIPGASGLSADGLRQYAQSVAQAAMFVGEFGALDPVRQQCDALEAEMRRFRLQSLSLFIWPESVGDHLQAQGCLQHLLDRVGPRVELERLELQGEARAGAPVTLVLGVRNDGFGRVVRPRPARLLVLPDGAPPHEIAIPLELLDLRRTEPEAPGSGTEFIIPFTLPPSLPTGEVTLAVVFDDPAPSLRGLAAYAMPLNSRAAGVDLFEPATGRNRLARFMVLRQ
jgi:hypothetical protein